MNIWHDTPDARRSPRRVSPSEEVELTIGTWPIELGQSVVVTWQAVSRSAICTDGTVVAHWHNNVGVNSYWTARLGPFADGDRVTYTIRGSSNTESVETGPFVIRVKAALYIAWLWHQHQPLYRDPTVETPAGSYRSPWVRLHGLRDYYSMPAIAAEQDVHMTFNLTPVLLRQIDDYVLNGQPIGCSTSRARRPRR